MYYSMVSYVIAVWGGLLCTQRCAGLISVHRRLVKNLFGRFHPGNEVVCIFKRERLLKVPDIYRLRVALYMFKIINFGSYPTLNEAINLQLPDHRYPTSSSNSYTLPRPRTEGVRRNFEYQFVSVWNAIPESLKSLSSVRTFKKSLIDHFLDSY